MDTGNVEHAVRHLVSLMLLAVVALGVSAASASAREASDATAAYSMVPSDRTVLPGQVVTVTVTGPGVERWGGGVASFFERRRRDGSWQRLYMLQWWGNNGVSGPEP